MNETTFEDKGIRFAGTSDKPLCLSCLQCENCGDNADIAVRSAKELVSWWKTKNAAGGLSSFELTLPDMPYVRLSAFFDTFNLFGKPTTTMGCLWKTRFRREGGSPTAAESASMQPFLRSRFLQLAGWRYRDGMRGGFGFTPVQYKTKTDAAPKAYPGSPGEKAPSIADIGTTYEWVVYRCDVHDFFRCIPGMKFMARPMSKIAKIATYDLIHEDYLTDITPPAEQPIAQCCFGYSFLPCLLEKSFFGYGPGHFAAALKQFRFALFANGEIEVQMIFLSAPRSEKVLSLWGFDPVYSLANIADALTLGALKIKERAHAGMDSFFLGHHARVYQTLINGMQPVWESQDWTKNF